MSITEFEELKNKNLIAKIHEIKQGKRLYWIWDGQIVPFKFNKQRGYHYFGKDKEKERGIEIYGEMELLKNVVINGHEIKKGDIRFFDMKVYGGNIGRNIFFSKSEAKEKLQQLKNETDSDTERSIKNDKV